MTPKQFFNEYTYNEILEDLYAHNQKLKYEDQARKRQAWYTWVCSMNRPLFGYEFPGAKDFFEIFPEEEPKEEKECNLAEVQAKCAKIGIRPPTK